MGINPDATNNQPTNKPANQSARHLNQTVSKSPPHADSPARNRSLPFLVGVGLFGIALAFNASILDPFVYSEKVRLLVPPAFKNTALGGLTILALLLALLTQPLVGQLSDRTRGRWGARIPYLILGAAGLSGALAVVVLADSFVLLILGALLVSGFANTTTARAPLSPAAPKIK